MGTSVVKGSILLTIFGETSAVDAAASDMRANGLTVPGFTTWNVLDTSRAGALVDEANTKLGAVWITLIIVLVCLCILGACFVRHYAKTPHDYSGGATPKAQPAILELDGKTMDYSNATYGNEDSDGDSNEKKGPPLPPRPVSS